jgi:hypothetical protein
VIELKRQEEEEDTEPERQQQAIANIRFGEPYENTRKHSKFDSGVDLVVVPVETRCFII